MEKTPKEMLKADSQEFSSTRHTRVDPSSTQNHAYPRQQQRNEGKQKDFPYLLLAIKSKLSIACAAFGFRIVMLEKM